MKKLFIFLLLIAGPLCCFAQSDAETFAKRAFKEGEYTDAVRWYQAAIAQTDSAVAKTSLEKGLAQAKKCDAALARAKTYYSQAKYADAKQAYKNLLAINASDPIAQKMIIQCDRKIANAAIAAADNELWAKVVESNDVSFYKQYLDRYPKGIHIAAANRYIAEDNLWNSVKQDGSEPAYRQYLEKSQLLLHKDEACVQLAYFEDARIWSKVQTEDSETAYRNYMANAGIHAQHKPEASAKIALYDAQTEFHAKQYMESRENFEKAKIYYTLDSQQDAMYRETCEITDFRSMSFYPTVEKGTAFLESYPSSSHIVEVKNLLAKAYCNRHEFTTASYYAQTPDMEKYIKEQKKQYKKDEKNRAHLGKMYEKYESADKSRNKSGHTESSKHSKTGYAINIGCDFDVWSFTYSYTVPRVEFSVGNFYNLFNMTVGLQYRRLTGWNKDDSVPDASDLGYDSNGHSVVPFGTDNQPHLVADQIGIPITFRFNIGSSSASTKFFIAAGASLNYNFSSKYKRPLQRLSGEAHTYDKFRNPDASLVNRFNVSTYGKIGLCWRNFDVSVFVRYEAMPAFDKNAVDTTIMYNDIAPINFYETYKPIRKQTDSKIAIGLALTWNIPL